MFVQISYTKMRYRIYIIGLEFKQVIVSSVLYTIFLTVFCWIVLEKLQKYSTYFNIFKSLSKIFLISKVKSDNHTLVFLSRCICMSKIKSITAVIVSLELWYHTLHTRSFKKFFFTEYYSNRYGFVMSGSPALMQRLF